jgi:succinyl-CoA synthetase beta subunit
MFPISNLSRFVRSLYNADGEAYATFDPKDTKTYQEFDDAGRVTKTVQNCQAGDVGGGANVQQVTEAFRILLGDPNVRAVLVNIFGGIMRCTTIAEALVEAYRTVRFTVPLVVRLEGTEVEQGCRILAESGLDIITAGDLTDAAQKVVAAASATLAMEKP